MDQTRTLGTTLPPAGADEGAILPGAVLVFSESAALCGVIKLDKGDVEIGRGIVGEVVIDDSRMSRRHVRLGFAKDRFTIVDLGSRNGFVVDDTKVEANGQIEVGPDAVIRLGNSLFLLVADVRPFRTDGVASANGRVIGPKLRACYRQIELAAGAGDTLHVTGESGSGKEGAARVFHEAGPRAGGPLIAVNCAAIPEGVAERLLFGARKGAFSGAHSDADGYLQAANGGTLFLDEIGELELTVQAKLLRVLESHEVLAVGATRPEKVELAIVSATNRDLRALVGEKQFREDLFYRIARPHVRLPPLRERRAEIPALARAAVDKIAPGMQMSTSLVATCMQRAWPGNVRELLRELQDAASRARGEGATSVDEHHLDASAGVPFAQAASPAAEQVRGTEESPTPLPPREEIERALRDAKGQVLTAARALGLHRNQLRRWLVRNDVDPRTFGDEP